MESFVQRSSQLIETLQTRLRRLPPTTPSAELMFTQYELDILTGMTQNETRLLQ